MNTAAFRRLFPLAVATVLLAISAVGCGRSGMHPVKGSVRYPDGSPVTTGKVLIDSGSAGVGSWGSILPDGTFRMGTHAPTDGVPAGEHRVSIVSACIYPAPGSSAEPTPLVHERYNDSKSSGLVFRVPDVTTWEIVVDPPEKQKRPKGPPQPAIDPSMTNEAAEERARKQEEWHKRQQ
jgi:hypothetical protein